MGPRTNRTLWAAWLLLTLGLGAALAWIMLTGSDKTLFMPGPLSPGHHQLRDNCRVCHKDALGGGEVL